MLVRRTNETGSGLWPSPTTKGLDGGSNSRKAAKARGMWPTPTVQGNYNKAGLSAKSGDGLATAVRKFATPTSSDARKWSNDTQAQREAHGRQVMLCHQLETGGALNPTWVEWLMGWPLGWTDLRPLEMDRCHSAQRALGSY